MKIEIFLLRRNCDFFLNDRVNNKNVLQYIFHIKLVNLHNLE